jgi:ribosome-associated protein
LASTKTVSRSRAAATTGPAGQKKSSATLKASGGGDVSGKRKPAAAAAASKAQGVKGKSTGSASNKSALRGSVAKTAGATAKPVPSARKPATKRAASAKDTAHGTSGKSAAAKSKPMASSSGKSAGRAKSKLNPVEKLRGQVVEGLDRIKARDVREIDVRGRASFADLLLIASGTSTTHVRAIADEVIKHAKKVGTMPLGVEGVREAEWVLVDLGDIVVHVMLPRVRDFYALERLWTVGAEDSSTATSA